MKKTKGFLFPIVALMFFYGCANYRSRPLLPSRTASQFEARTLDSPGLREFMEKDKNKKIHHRIKHWPPEAWDFRMLELAAAYYSPALDVMREKWGVAKAAVITAGGRPNPGASLLGQHHSSTPGGISPWTWGISLDIPVETAGKRGYRIRQAKHLSAAAQLNIAETAWQVRSSLRKGLLDLYAATGRQRYLMDRFSVERKIAGLFEERLAVGESSQFEVTQSRLALDKTRLLLAGNQKKKAEARNALAEALGLQVKALDGIRISFDLFKRRPETVNLKDIRRRALMDRADILSALQEYEASQAALQLEIAKQYPDIHLGPGYEWDQGDNKWTLGFGISLPVFNQNQGPIAEAKARRGEMAAKFIALQAGVIEQIARAEAAYSVSIANLDAARSLARDEKAALSAEKLRFKSGEVGLLDLEQARMQLASTELFRFEAFISAQRAFGRLEDAVERPLDNMGKPAIKNGVKK